MTHPPEVPLPRRSDARPRAVATAARLLQEQGYAATGLEQVLTESGAPKGSFYFHFPGGKEQLAAEALTASGELVGAVIAGVLADAGGPGDAVRSFAALQAAQLAGSDFRHGCPIATVALERAGRPSAAADAATTALRSWQDRLATHFADAGCDGPEVLAEVVLAAMEGALVLARAARDADLVVRVGQQMGSMVDAAVAQRERR